jgi:hypothetical protein
MKSQTILLILFAASLCLSQDVTQRDDSSSGLVVLKLKRERRREQPNDVRHTATDPDALNNTGVMPSGGGSQFPNFIYEYSAEIRNDSPKSIKWLSCVYHLFDPESKQETDRQDMVSFDKISAGQKKTVTARKRIASTQPGAGDSRKGAPLDERVEFRCVGYDDGTLWHAPMVSESQCRDMEKRGKSR